MSSAGDDAVAGQRLGFLENLLRNDVERDLRVWFLPARAASSFCAAISGWHAFLAELERGVEIRLA